LQRGGLPLRDREVRDPDQANCAGAPRLCRRPLDEVVDVFALLIGQQRTHAVGATRPPQIAIHHREALRGPPGRIGRLPPGQTGEPDTRRLAQHPVLKRHRIAPLRPSRHVVLAVGMRAHQHRERTLAAGQVYVDPQHRPIVGRHRDVMPHNDRAGPRLVNVCGRTQEAAEPSERIACCAGAFPRAVQRRGVG
jgi:hypothetical protein